MFMVGAQAQVLALVMIGSGARQSPQALAQVLGLLVETVSERIACAIGRFLARRIRMHPSTEDRAGGVDRWRWEALEGHILRAQEDPSVGL